MVFFFIPIVNKFSPLIKFLVKALLVYISWYLLYDLWLHPHGVIDAFVTENAMKLSGWILNALGFVVYIKGHHIGIEPVRGVSIGDPCNGINLFALFAGFIICYNGAIRKKLLYIPMGIFIIHLLNVIRIITLILILKYAPSSLAFNHTYTFTTVVYLCIFILWMVWVNYFSISKIKVDDKV